MPLNGFEGIQALKQFCGTYGVSVINAKYFSTYFDRLPEDTMAAAVWEKGGVLNGLVK